jgi:serine/threonine protein kinase
MGGGFSKKPGTVPSTEAKGRSAAAPGLAAAEADAAGGRQVRFGAADVCQLAATPAPAPDTQFEARRSAETAGGVLHTRAGHCETPRAQGSLSQDDADMERLSRTVWIGNIPVNYAIPEKLMEIFEATAVPQVAQTRVKESSAPGLPQMAWGLVTFKSPEGAATVCQQKWTVNDGSEDAEDVELDIKMCDIERALKSALSSAVAVKQWGIAFSNRWGHCTVHSSCPAYASAIRVRGSDGGGPCTNCGCYPAAHIHLGHYPTRCAIDGCPCRVFHPENAPSTLTDLVSDRDGRSVERDCGDMFNQAHSNSICGVCGHSSKNHTAPYDRWEVRWPDIDVLEKLGEGRHGRVHRCTLWNREYAVKILKKDNWTGAALSNFLREMSTLASLRHPHIQELVAGVTDTKAARKGTSSLAIVTTLAENGDLRDVIIKQPPQLTESKWITMALDIAKGVEYLHSLSPPIVHRDLKPMNCMVDRAWRVRVADFALAGTVQGRLDDDDANSDGQGTYDLSMDLVTLTTETQAAYMPPEMLKISTARTTLEMMKNNKNHRSSGMLISRDQHGNLQARVSSTLKLTAEASRRATGVDTWAFGMLLWAIVHRKRPFTGWEARTVAEHVVKSCDEGVLPLQLCDPPPDDGRQDTRPEDERRSFCRATTAALLHGCWHKDPETRPVFGDIIESLGRVKLEALRTEEAARSARRAAREHERSQVGLGDTSAYVSNETRTIDVATDIEMLDLTGSGGFGKVYRGLWAGTEVAVKLLHNQDMSQKLLDEMKSEVQVLQRLHHPNIVMLMGMCTKPPNVSIITEFLGRTDE